MSFKFYPLTSTFVSSSVADHEPIGVVRVQVKEAKDLKNVETFSTPSYLLLDLMSR